MRLAYAVQAHRNPQQVARLLDAIAVPGDSIALGWDTKAGDGFVPAIRAAMRSGRQDAVRVLAPTDNTWGGWSLSAALLGCLDELLRHGGDWDFAVNLSGQCLPTQPTDALRARLAAHRGACFMECFELSSQWTDALSRVRTVHVEWRGRTRNTRLPRPAPRAFVLHGGSAFAMLSRAFVEHLLTDDGARRIARWFRHARIPDELLLQTVLMNSPHAASLVPRTHRLVLWDDTGDGHPRVLTGRDWPRIVDPDIHFARKFDTGVDAAIVERVLERARG